MPIEVKELIMRFNVADQLANEPEEKEEYRPDLNAARLDDIVNGCVQQVLKILEQANER